MHSPDLWHYWIYRFIGLLDHPGSTWIQIAEMNEGQSVVTKSHTYVNIYV